MSKTFSEPFCYASFYYRLFPLKKKKKKEIDFPISPSFNEAMLGDQLLYATDITKRLNDKEAEQDEKKMTPSSLAVRNKAVKETAAFSLMKTRSPHSSHVRRSKANSVT